jgi:hypothetical protein
MAKVVCVKVKNIRPEYDNLEEWMKGENNLYIGRKGIVFINKERYPKVDSFWANPYKIGKDGDRNEVIEKYKIYITNKLSENPDKINELKNAKFLGCWCAPDPCHGDFLLTLI